MEITQNATQKNKAIKSKRGWGVGAEEVHEHASVRIQEKRETTDRDTGDKCMRGTEAFREKP